MDLHLRNPHRRRAGLLEVQQVRWRTGVSGLPGRCAHKASLHQKSKGMVARHQGWRSVGSAGGGVRGHHGARVMAKAEQHGVQPHLWDRVGAAVD